MLVLFLYLLWSVSYIVTWLLFNMFFFKNIFNKKSIITKFFLIIFFNKNLSFYKNELSFLEIQEINFIRFNKLPLLNTLHNKIDYIFLKDKQNTVSFKEQYKIFKYSTNNNLNNSLFENNITLLDYSLIQNILKENINYRLFSVYNILYLNIFKNSISNNDFKVDLKINSNNYNKFTDILFYKKKIINTVNYIAKINKSEHSIVSINSSFFDIIKNIYKINFSASNIVKYLYDLSISKSNILFLRKNKVFNKSRYSRNRQTYRTGAYWCLYINIIAVIAFYFWFYNFTMNFGYLWWLLYSFVLSFFLFKAIKFNFYNPITIIKEFILSIKWVYLVIIDLNSIILTTYTKFYNLYSINYIVSKYYKFISTNKFILLLNKINDFIYKYL